MVSKFFSKSLILCVGLIFLLLNISRAQNYVDIARTYYSYSVPSGFEGSNRSTDIKDFGAVLTAPIQLKGGNAIITGVDYQNLAVAVYPEGHAIRLQSGTLKFGANIKHSEKLSGTYVFLPKLATACKEKSNKNYQFGGVALLDIKENEHFLYRIGLYYNTETFGPFYAPFIGCYWKTERIEINATVPVYCDVNIKCSEMISVGADFSAMTESYYLGHEGDSESSTGLARASNELFAYSMFKVSRNVFLRVKAGYTIARKYEVYDYSDKLDYQLSAFKFGDSRTQKNVNFSDGIVALIDLRYRFWIE